MRMRQAVGQVRHRGRDVEGFAGDDERYGYEDQHDTREGCAA